MDNTRGGPGRNSAYYKTKVAKSRKAPGNFFEHSRKRQLNSYIRAVTIVSVIMLVVTGFITLGVFLQNLTAEHVDMPALRADINAPVFGALAAYEEEGVDIAEIFYGFRGVHLDLARIESLYELQDFIDGAQSQNINAVRIDIKRPDGVIPFRVNGYFTAVVGEHNKIDLDIGEIIEMLHAGGMYISGRIACFRDDLASTWRAGYAFHDAVTGLRFTDGGGSAWLNVYSEGARDYILELVGESLALGFDEIILDYFFLPNSAGVSQSYYEESGVARNVAVRNFVMQVRDLVSEQAPHVRLGLNFPIRHLLNAPVDAMGMNPSELVGMSDFFTTSFAPRDLPDGALGIANPAGSPYETVRALGDRFSELAGRIMLRPDLHDDGQLTSKRQALQGAGIGVWTLVNYD